jgi:hypothetical protein
MIQRLEPEPGRTDAARSRATRSAPMIVGRGYSLHRAQPSACLYVRRGKHQSQGCQSGCVRGHSLSPGLEHTPTPARTGVESIEAFSGLDRGGTDRWNGDHDGSKGGEHGN